ALVREEFGGRGAFMFRSADRTGLASEGSRAKAFSNRTANSCRLMASAPARWYTPPSGSSRSRRIAAARPSAKVGEPIQSVTTLCIAAVSTTEAGFVWRTRAIASSTRSLCSGTNSTPAILGFVSRYVATTWNAFDARLATFAPTSPLPPTTRSVSMALGFQGRRGERDRLNAVKLLRQGPDAFDDAHLRPEPELAEPAPVDLVGQLVEARRLRRRDLHRGEHVPDRADDRLHVRVLMDRVEDEPLRLRVARGDPVRLHRVRRRQVRSLLAPSRVVHRQRPSLGREVREAIDDRVESHPDRPAVDRA